MKRTLAALFALMLLAGAAAESVNVEVGQVYAADLNENGFQESYRWTYRTGESGGERLCLEITDEDGAVVTYETQIVDPAALWLKDFRGPALVVTGWNADGEGRTFALRYTAKGRVTEIMFAADARTRVPEDYCTPYGVGVIAGMSGDRVTLESEADVLGTWLAVRGYTLNENDRFAFEPGLWTTTARLNDPGVWRDMALTTAADLEYTDIDNESATLPEDTRLLITATDKETLARFVTEAGVSGTFDIAPCEDGEPYRYYVGGLPEDEAFEYLPYTR